MNQYYAKLEEVVGDGKEAYHWEITIAIVKKARLARLFAAFVSGQHGQVVNSRFRRSHRTVAPPILIIIQSTNRMEAQTSKSLWSWTAWSLLQSFANYIIIENIQIRVNGIANGTSGSLPTAANAPKPVRNYPFTGGTASHSLESKVLLKHTEQPPPIAAPTPTGRYQHFPEVGRPVYVPPEGSGEWEHGVCDANKRCDICCTAYCCGV